MPSKSKKQHNLMAAVANNPKLAKKVGIPQSVGEDYVEADKGRKFKEGGPMKMARGGTKKMKAGGMTGKTGPKKRDPRAEAAAGMSFGGKGAKGLKEAKEMLRELEARRDASGSGKKPTTTKMARGGMTKMARGGMAMGAGKGYKAGGPLPMVEKDGQKVPFYAADGKGKMARGGKVNGTGFKKGGKIDGCAKRGRTRGQMR